MSDITSFPTLYKRDSTGKVREWTMWVVHYADNSEIYSKHGVHGGKIVEKKPTVVSSGKNIGKSNETTIKQQAISMANSLFDKKKEKEQFNESMENVLEENSSKNFRPMLATSFDMKKVKFPKYIQPKLDGVRCNACNIDGKIMLLSRTGKEIYNLHHIRDEISKMNLSSNIVLDGEVGCFGENPELTFQQSVGLIKKKELAKKNPEEIKIEYHLYDIFDKSQPNLTFEERWNLLVSYAKESDCCVKLCCDSKLKAVNNTDEIDEGLEKFLRMGFEGLMVRDPSGKYELDKRSRGLSKYKKFVDSEFEIVGFKAGTGQDAGTIIFGCQNESGQTFDVRPTGTLEERKKMFEDGKNLVGKKLTVKYFELTDEGIPRFPVGIAIRDYE